MSKRKFNSPSDILTTVRGYGVYLITNQGKAHGYIDRPLDNGVYTSPLLSFQSPAKARMAAAKLKYAGEKFGKWAILPAQAVDILNTELIETPQPIAYVVCYRPSGWRNNAVTYVLREWTTEDAADLEHGEVDKSIVFEATDYEQAKFVRDLLHREFRLNGTRAASLADVLDIMKEYANVS